MPDDLLDRLARVVAPLGTLVEAVRLTGGLFATTHRVTLADGSRVVVKTAPTTTGTLLTYEHRLVRSEALVYGRVADRPDLLMPRLLRFDESGADLPGDVVVAEHLDGVPWQDAGFGPVAEDPRAARAQRDLGAFIARLHTVTGDRFGYVGAVDAPGGAADPAGSRLHGDTWPEAFGRMVEAVLHDAGRWGVDLRPGDVRRVLARHHDALAQVTTPVLVHGDLWPGNLFVAADGALVGVIDPERALWADPLMELVGADQFGRGDVAPGLRAGHEQVAPLDLESSGARVRFLLYRLYMSAILHVECVPRAYAGDFGDWYRRTSGELLAWTLDALDS
ncbi:phosphotransferase [Cellulomonas phragmiteti]|uniref:Phosphotransferase n=1 Tax=Cellulomonas phragmiteti TaxID=478780 RepID=A0ABQ4DRW3_9CELL|nr:phosphotransferase [Cellulomonas phragmiteti]